MSDPAPARAALFQNLSYARPSTASDGLHLVASEASTPWLFRGELRNPRQSAELLLTMAQVARSRFHVPPAMRARLIRESDPIVTGDGRTLRLEAFSSCCGVYARVDLLPESLIGEWTGRGTTNVDFNPPLRAALAGLRVGERLAFSVGREAVEVAVDDAAVVEKQVPLPVRWLRGLVEAQRYLSQLEPGPVIDAAEARRFVRGLPRSGRAQLYLVPAGRGVRLSQRGEMALGGPERLRLLEPLLRFVERVAFWGHPEGQAAAVVAQLAGARLTLLLSASVWRGLSGEGQALTALSQEAAVAQVAAALEWGQAEVVTIASQTGLSPDAVDRALSHLGARGQVGFDLDAQAWFKRPLPYDLAQVDALQPRLRSARKLVSEGCVRLDGDRAVVASGGVEHRVQLESGRCTCPWFAKHQGQRGPCKHVLAAQIVEAE